MKRLILLLLFTSCITTGVSESYEGRWHSNHLPFGPLATEAVIEMGRHGVVVEVDGDMVGSGKYTIIEGNAIFGWELDIHGEEILFLDASCKGEVLFVRWKSSSFWYPYTSGFNRQ